MCITTYQPDTKSKPNPNPNPNVTTKQHAIHSTEYSHMSYVSRRIHTRQCCRTVCATLGCNCHTAVHIHSYTPVRSRSKAWAWRQHDSCTPRPDARSRRQLTAGDLASPQTRASNCSPADHSNASHGMRSQQRRWSTDGRQAYSCHHVYLFNNNQVRMNSNSQYHVEQEWQG